MWFAQVESVFARHKIERDDLKTQILTSQVNADTLNCVRHIVMSRPKPLNSYTQIRNGIISHYSVSNETRIFKLIHGDIVVPGKPSQILSRLRSLNTGNCDENVLKVIFFN